MIILPLVSSIRRLMKQGMLKLSNPAAGIYLLDELIGRLVMYVDQLDCYAPSGAMDIYMLDWMLLVSLLYQYHHRTYYLFTQPTGA